MTPAEFRAFFARRREVVARNDVFAYVADYTEDCVTRKPAGGTLKGRAAVEAAYRLWLAAFPDWAAHDHDMLVDGDRVVETMTVTGTDCGVGMFGRPPSGKRFAFQMVCFYTFRDRQILHERRSYDFHGFMLQLTTGGIGSDFAQEYGLALNRAITEQELKVAAEIQQALLPKFERRNAEFDVAAVSVPCRAIGGDFVDYFDLPNEEFGFVLGDVSGKGTPAALLAAELQGFLSACSAMGGTPAETMDRVNQLLVRIESRFATMLYGHLARDGRLTYCNAGHNPPLVCRSCWHTEAGEWRSAPRSL